MKYIQGGKKNQNKIKKNCKHIKKMLQRPANNLILLMGMTLSLSLKAALLRFTIHGQLVELL